MPHDHAHSHPHTHGSHVAGPRDEDDLIELLDLDAEVLHDYLSDVTSWVRSLAPEPCARIVDIGAGTGTGSFALARLFDDAQVVAVDQSPEMLAHLRQRADTAGLADRVRPMRADLDDGWPVAEPVDLIWASMSLHHLTDPDRSLREIMAALRPDGVLAVVEIDGQPSFLPDDLGVGRPGLEARCRAALEQEHAEQVPHLGSDWDARFAATDVDVLDRREFGIDLAPPLPTAAGRYARGYLARLRPALDGRLDRDDLDTLDRLLDDDGPDSVVGRQDLHVRTVRTAWVVRRR